MSAKVFRPTPTQGFKNHKKLFGLDSQRKHGKFLDKFDPLNSSAGLHRTVDSLTGGLSIRKKKDKDKAAAREFSKLRAESQADDTISDITKAELGATRLNHSNIQGSLGAFKKVFGQAKEGVLPKFKSRQNTQALFETMFDKPGRRQTIISASNRNNSLLR